MLRTRIITALILAPLAVAGIFLLPSNAFAVVFWCAAALGAWEWAGLMGLRHPAARGAWVALYGASALWLYARPDLYGVVLYGGWVVWGTALIAVLSYPRGAWMFRNPVSLGLQGFVIMLGAWLSLVVIQQREDGPLWLLWLFLLVWGADIGAYFAGRAFGRHKLAPQVSPGKTWEGVLGGISLAGIACGGILLAWQPGPEAMLLGMFALIFVSVVGDLLVSVAKRATGVKDTGTLLPGHGGVMDRIDSIVAVLPFLAVVLL